MSRVISGFVILALLMAYVMSFLFHIDGSVRSYSAAVIIGMLINGAIAIAFIVADVRNYSLAKVHWYFILIFFAIAPLAQYTTSYYPWNYTVSTDAMVKANGVVTLWCVSFGVASYFAKSSRTMRKLARGGGKSTALPSSWGFGAIIVLLALACAGYLIARLGLDQLLTSRSIDQNPSNWLMWILAYAIPTVPAIGCCVCFLLARRTRSAIWAIPGIALLAITVLCNSPIYSSRYWVAVIYVPILMAIVPDRAFNHRTFDIVLLLALIVVFPMMNAFKTMTIGQVTLGYLFETFAGSYNSIDFDAYSMLARIIDYADANGLMLGAQLLSSVLYVLPTMSSQVNVPTGELVSNAQSAAYTNLSAPLPSEGYIDFGLLGVVLFAVVTALVMWTVDRKYWNADFKAGIPSFIFPVYFALIAFVMFAMRGALQPVLFRMETYFLFVIVLYLCCRLRNRLAERRLAR
jgi:oligosaccharide repeat unit polymerase